MSNENVILYADRPVSLSEVEVAISDAINILKSAVSGATGGLARALSRLDIVGVGPDGEFLAEATVRDERPLNFSGRRFARPEDLDKIAKEWGEELDRTIFDRLHIRTLADLTTVTLAERSYDIDQVSGDIHVDVYVGAQEEANTIFGTTGNDLEWRLAA